MFFITKPSGTTFDHSESDLRIYNHQKTILAKYIRRELKEALEIRHEYYNTQLDQLIRISFTAVSYSDVLPEHLRYALYLYLKMEGFSYRSQLETYGKEGLELLYINYKGLYEKWIKTIGLTQ